MMVKLAALMGLYIHLAILWLIFAAKSCIMCAAKKLEVKPADKNRGYSGPQSRE
jgi:hypothetical protein